MDDYVLDIAAHSLNKTNEELCGDQIQVFKDQGDAIVILSDGLGSGVKANILATLTTEIAMTMLKEQQSLEETIMTIMNTLPVCQTRKIAYSTFSILKIDNYTQCTLIEYDNPDVFIKQQGRIHKVEKKRRIYSNKKINYSTFELTEDMVVTLVSDGVIHAGVGQELNHGWEWTHVADFLKKQTIESAELYNRQLIQTCNNLYQGTPGDDTSAVSIHLTTTKVINILIGPPEDPSLDTTVAQLMEKNTGQKIICGGTTAKIIARELDRELVTSFDYINTTVPPIAKIEGFDLVTEGMLTLKETYKRLACFNQSNDVIIDSKNKDGAQLLLKKLVDEGNVINFYIGKAVNPVVQAQDIPFKLGVKHSIIEKIMTELKRLDKTINVQYF